MEEFKLFNELYLIKYEIERDLDAINKMQCDEKLKSIIGKNRELENEMLLIKQGFDFEIQEKISENLSLNNEIERRGEIIEERDGKIRKLNDTLKDLIDENNRINVEFNNLKGILLCFINFYNLLNI